MTLLIVLCDKKFLYYKSICIRTYTVLLLLWMWVVFKKTKLTFYNFCIIVD